MNHSPTDNHDLVAQARQRGFEIVVVQFGKRDRPWQQRPDMEGKLGRDLEAIQVGSFTHTFRDLHFYQVSDIPLALATLAKGLERRDIEATIYSVESATQLRVIHPADKAGQTINLTE